MHNKKVTFDGIRAADAAFYPDHPRLYREEDRFIAELSGTFQLLGYDSVGHLQCVSKKWEQECDIPADRSVRMEAALQPRAQVDPIFHSDGATLSSSLLLHTAALCLQGLPMVTSMELSEKKQADPERPALILRRAGDESLWLLAKELGTTMEAIRQANNLEEDPDPDRMLIIPIT